MIAGLRSLSPPTSTIFICYRREDAAGHAGRVRDRLVRVFGDGSVFMDVHGIHPGADFRHTIEQTIGKCDTVLAIIGPRWLKGFEVHAGEEDLVSVEILAAFAADVTVIPVLVGGAAMPADREVPEGLRRVTRNEAVEIRDIAFDDDIQRLVGFLRSQRGLTPFDLSGRWTVEMTRTDDFAVKNQFGPFRTHLDLYVLDGAVTGSVSYRTGDGVIIEGAATGRRITFKTSHVPQFEQQPAVIRFMGEIVKEELHLRSVDELGIVSQGIARRR